jgi:putative NADPH-quinone reductase
MTSKRIAIIQAHPDSSPERLCRKLADSYSEAARAAGHEVTVIDLAALRFPLLGSVEEFEHQPLPASLGPASTAVAGADHIVMVFPLWLGTMPALLKAFLEQLFRPGIAFRYRTKGFPEKLFKGKSARLVVTMGMPAMLYRFWYGAAGIRGLRRNILEFAGIEPVRVSYLGMVEGVSAKRRAAWIKRMAELGSKGR